MTSTPLTVPSKPAFVGTIDDYELSSYLVIVFDRACKCGQSHRSSEIQELWTHRAAFATTAMVSMRPLKELKPNYPIAVVNKSQQVALCHHCATEASGTFQIERARSEQEWTRMLQRKKQVQLEEIRVAARTSTPRPEPSLESL